MSSPTWIRITWNIAKNAAINYGFDFALIKLRTFEFPHQQTTWMQSTCMTWHVSPSLVNKSMLEELELS